MRLIYNKKANTYITQTCLYILGKKSFRGYENQVKFIVFK